MSDSLLAFPVRHITVHTGHLPSLANEHTGRTG